MDMRLLQALPQEIAESICAVLCQLDKDRNKTRRLGEEARKRIRSAYNERQFLDDMGWIYNSALGFDE
jgi:hypothetical protein